MMIERRLREAFAEWLEEEITRPDSNIFVVGLPEGMPYAVWSNILHHAPGNVRLNIKIRRDAAGIMMDGLDGVWERIASDRDYMGMPTKWEAKDMIFN